MENPVCFYLWKGTLSHTSSSSDIVLNMCASFKNKKMWFPRNPALPFLCVYVVVFLFFFLFVQLHYIFQGKCLLVLRSNQKTAKQWKLSVETVSMLPWLVKSKRNFLYTFWNSKTDHVLYFMVRRPCWKKLLQKPAVAFSSSFFFFF